MRVSTYSVCISSSLSVTFFPYFKSRPTALGVTIKSSRGNLAHTASVPHVLPVARPHFFVQTVNEVGHTLTFRKNSPNFLRCPTVSPLQIISPFGIKMTSKYASSITPDGVKGLSFIIFSSINLQLANKLVATSPTKPLHSTQKKTTRQGWLFVLSDNHLAFLHNTRSGHTVKGAALCPRSRKWVSA
jgi:hypothetical protein